MASHLPEVSALEYKQEAGAGLLSKERFSVSGRPGTFPAPPTPPRSSALLRLRMSVDLFRLHKGSVKVIRRRHAKRSELKLYCELDPALSQLPLQLLAFAAP
jgi:hypothetical protein